MSKVANRAGNAGAPQPKYTSPDVFSAVAHAVAALSIHKQKALLIGGASSLFLFGMLVLLRNPDEDSPFIWWSPFLASIAYCIGWSMYGTFFQTRIVTNRRKLVLDMFGLGAIDGLLTSGFNPDYVKDLIHTLALFVFGWLLFISIDHSSYYHQFFPRIGTELVAFAWSALLFDAVVIMSLHQTKKRL